MRFPDWVWRFWEYWPVGAAVLVGAIILAVFVCLAWALSMAIGDLGNWIEHLVTISAGGNTTQ